MLQRSSAMSLAPERRQQFAARLFATPALLRAQPAVLVVAGVALALLGARTAHRQAGLQRSQLRRRVGVGLPAEDAARVDAGVGAVKAQANAANELGDVGLRERGV